MPPVTDPEKKNITSKKSTSFKEVIVVSRGYS
jgi:hypothetical protein